MSTDREAEAKEKQPYEAPEIQVIEIDLTETMRMASGWVDD